MTEYFYNLATGQVEEGRMSEGLELMGPYPTREAAADALSHASQRNAEWDEADRAWNDDDEEWGKNPAPKRP